MAALPQIATGSRTGGHSGSTGAILLLAAAVLLSFGASLWGDFVWDDRPLIVDNPLVQEPSKVSALLVSSFWDTGGRHDRFRSFFRPVVHLSYALDYALWQKSPAGYHLTNLLLHFACCVLIYRIARSEGLEATGACCGAALFAVHPVHAESVAWISGRTDLLCGLFLFGAFLLHRGAMRSGGGRRLRALSLGLFALALFSKEMAATLPALVFLDRWLTAPGKHRLRNAARQALPYLGVLLGYLAIRHLVLGAGAPPRLVLDVATYLATAIFVVARYLTLLLLPVGLDAHYPYPVPDSWLTPAVGLSALMLAIVVVVSRILVRRSPTVAYWIFWFMLTLLPVLAFGRFGDVLMADRFLYIPSAALALLAGHAIVVASRRVRARSRPAWVLAALGPLMVMLAASSWSRTLDWKDDLTLFADMARTSPDSALVRYNLGLAHYQRGDLDTAIAEFQTAVELAPDYAMAHNNLAAALEFRGKDREALEHYLAALDAVPGQPEAGINAGHLLVRLGRPEDGLRRLQAVVGDFPEHPPGLYIYADALRRTGRVDQAIVQLERARAIDPDYPNPHYLLGKLRYEQGRHVEARAAMERFLELWPRDDRYRRAATAVVFRASDGRSRMKASTPAP